MEGPQCTVIKPSELELAAIYITNFMFSSLPRDTLAPQKPDALLGQSRRKILQNILLIYSPYKK